MTLQLPSGLVYFAVIIGLLTPFIACWWTYWIGSKQQDRTLIDAMRDSMEKSINTCLKAADITAEVTRGVQANTKHVYQAFEDSVAALIEMDPSKTIERMAHQALDRSMPGRKDASGRNGHVKRNISAANQESVESSGRPPGVKLPSEM